MPKGIMHMVVVASSPLIDQDETSQAKLTYACGRKCFPVCPRTQHLLRTQIETGKSVSEFIQKHFASATNVSPFARRNICVRKNVSLFATAFTRGLFN